MTFKLLSDDSYVDELLDVLDKLENGYIEVGILGDGKKYKDGMTVLGIATVHEFGFTGPDKLGRMLNIPERSFIRASYDENRDWSKFDSMVQDAVELKIPVKTVFDAIGMECVKIIQDYIRSMDQPSLKAATKAAKGSSKLLIDTGQLINSIDYKIYYK